MKPGWMTTEFWLAAASSIVGVVGVLWGLSPGDQADLAEQLKGGIVAAGGLIASATATWQYIAARTALKGTHASLASPPDNQSVYVSE